MTCQEHPVLLFISLESFEFTILPASLIVLDVLRHEVGDEGVHHVQFEVVLEVELLAFLSLQESEVIVFVALAGNDLLQLLSTLHLELKENAFL